MCDINLNEKSRRKVGYKMLAQNIKTGQLYSSFTGEPYNTGIVPKPPTYCKRIASWNHDLDDFVFETLMFHNKSFEGNSAAFVNIADAKSMLNDMHILNDYQHQYDKEYKLIIVKITFEGTTYKGYYSADVICGNNVKSIKIL